MLFLLPLCIESVIHLKKLKVLHVVEALGGGVYSYFCDLSHIMGNDPRLDVYIAFNNKRSEIDPEKIADDFNENCELIRLDLHKEISFIKDWKGILQIKKVLERIKPDIIHLHSSKAGVLGKIAYKIAAVKSEVFYTPHGYAFLRQDISSKKRLLYKFIEKYSQKLLGGITIACGDTEQQEAHKMHLKATLIRNGVPIQKIANYKRDIINKTLTIGILGRITYARNPAFFNEIAFAHPGINFIWIGDGDLRHEITAPNISITGWFTDRYSGLRHMNGIDIYLQTSLWEGLPIAVLEAMVFKKPVIATDVIGNKDIVLDGKTGFLIKDLNDAIKAITALKDPLLRNVMGNAAHDRANKLFDSTTNFNALTDYFLETYHSK